jgi:ankyrin repeat protein
MQAAAYDDTEALRTYLATGADPNGPGTGDCFLAAAAAADCLDCVRLLLDHGADPHFGSEDALRCAAGKGAIRCLKALLAAGADPNVTTGIVGLDGHRLPFPRALSQAAYGGHLDCVDALIGAGADLDADNRAALRAATGQGHRDCVERLLAAGADPGGDEGDDPIHAAEKLNHPEVAALLRKAIARRTRSRRWWPWREQRNGA